MTFDFSLNEILTFIFLINSFIALAGFFTTFKDVWNGIPSANIMTYIQWTWVNGFGAVYGYIKLEDFAYTFLSGSAFLFCVVILVLRLRIKEENNSTIPS